MDREMRLDAGDRSGTALGAYVLGLAFAFGWTPCIGPVLGASLSLAASEADVTRGTALLAFYAAGLGIPFLLVATFFPRLSGFMTWMRRHTEKIERVTGLLLWTVGLLLLTGRFHRFQLVAERDIPGSAILRLVPGDDLASSVRGSRPFRGDLDPDVVTLDGTLLRNAWRVICTRDRP